MIKNLHQELHQWKKKLHQDSLNNQKVKTFVLLLYGNLSVKNTPKFYSKHF